MAQDGPGAVPVDEGIQFLFGFFQGHGQFFRQQFGHILFGIVDPGGQVGVQSLQSGLDARDLFGQGPVQGGAGQSGPLPSAGGDDLHDGFGLGQADAPVDQGPAGELAGGGGHRPGQIEGFQQTVGHDGAAVHRKFNDIFPGVAVGCPVKQGHRLVHGPAPQQKMTEQGGIAFGVGHFLVDVDRYKDLFHNGIGVGSAHTDHRDAAFPGRRGQGADGG